MKKKIIKISFVDELEVDESTTENQVYDIFLDYLKDCVKYEDVTAFNFEEVQ